VNAEGNIGQVGCCGPLALPTGLMGCPTWPIPRGDLALARGSPNLAIGDDEVTRLRAVRVEERVASDSPAGNTRWSQIAAEFRWRLTHHRVFVP
jgi:hypothetical protein